MAVRETRIDDLDGSTDGVQSITFSLDAATYEIDLSASNRAALFDALRPFIEAARPAGSAFPATKAKRRPAAGSAMRQWARANGIPVPDRGRIPKHVVDAYAARHSS